LKLGSSQILSDDWTKTIHLQNDRTIELHTQGGFHYRTRLPRFGRALAYHFPSCDALFGATGNEVHRLNLYQGRFLKPLFLQGEDGAGVAGVNAVEVNQAHQLFAFGIEGDGTVQFWDPRSRDRVGLLRLPTSRLLPTGAAVLPLTDGSTAPSVSVTALASRLDGLSYAIGTSTGHTLLYDLRAARPFAVKDQGYGLPVKCLTWIEGGGRMAGDGMVLSADKKVIKIWDRHSVSNEIWFPSHLCPYRSFFKAFYEFRVYDSRDGSERRSPRRRQWADHGGERGDSDDDLLRPAAWTRTSVGELPRERNRGDGGIRDEECL
jgi:ribosome biogenesis protein ENP2